MTTPANHDLESVAAFTPASYAEEHLTMHQFMYETTAADPTSRGFLASDHGNGQQADLDSAIRIVPRVRIRIYP